jgi:hypothetical protein
MPKAAGQRLRRDRLWREDGKVNFVAQAKDDFVAPAVAELEAIQQACTPKRRRSAMRRWCAA